ncbi:MAG: metallo-mystery pair system four-Cys motif protein [Myxococcales bacterium]|nr:metallo-mystery pair system four-Cys motif protein [Myxococcales bacterium]
MLALTGCGDNDNHDHPDAAVQPDAPDTSPRAVTINFKPMVGTQAFACGTNYPSMGSVPTTITPRDFRFYAYDFKLLAANGETSALTLDQNEWQNQNVAMLDFENFTGGCMDGTPATNLKVTGMVANGTYRGISFRVGIPDTMNHKDLTTAPAPLNASSLFWDWNFGHIFLAVVTHADIPASGTNPAGTNDHYFHVGSTGCTGDATMGQAVTCTNVNSPLVEVIGFDPLTMPVIADFAAPLTNVDLKTAAGCHSFPSSTAFPSDCDFPFDSVGLNFVTGSMTPTTQKMFKPGT